MKKQLLVGLFLFPTVLQPLLADKLITDSPITVSQERQQTKKITGTILDTTGMPVIGANVMVKELLTVRLPIWMVNSHWM